MTDWIFDKNAITTMRFVRCAFNPANGEISLVYAFDDSPELIETICLTGAPFTLDKSRAHAAQRALELLHLITGISYYKAAVPPAIRIDTYSIDSDTAELIRLIYENGLGEFAYRNNLILRDRIMFPAQGSVRSTASTLGLADHALTAIGGGKDSLVSIEALRKFDIKQTVSWIGNSPLIRACAEHTQLPALNITRQLAPALFEFNKRGAWNGHIPVTAINSAILVFAAIVLGVNQVVFSNESSASYGSQLPGAGEVNHQWSKGWVFENAFGKYVGKYIAADLSYYSLLRPYSELAIARQFAHLENYDAYFSSCNRNFHLLGDRPTQRWCGQCPKCHFVFLALAPFMPKPRLLGIFGRNLLDEIDQIAGYDALIEYRDHKPFECVGEARESRAALADLAKRSAWREDAVVARFAREILPQLDSSQLNVAALLEGSAQQRIPTLIREKLDAHFRA